MSASMFELRYPRRLVGAIATVTALVLSLLATVTVAGPVSESEAAAATSTGPLAGFVRVKDRYATFDLPGQRTMTALNGINNSGQIVGKYPDSRGFHGLLRDQRGKLVRIDVPGAKGTYVTKINDRGQIVGSSNDVSAEVGVEGTKGFLLSRGRFTTIAYPRALFTQAYGINNAGTVVGEFLDKSGVIHGFLWRRGHFTVIKMPNAATTSATDINDRGQIIGLYASRSDPTRVRGFRLSNGRYATFAAPGDPSATLPFDINNRGQIVGYSLSDLAQPAFDSFLLASGVGGDFTPLDVPGGLTTVVGGINDQGHIVGVYERSGSDGGHRAADRPGRSVIPNAMGLRLP